MKIFSYMFRPYFIIRELQKENNSLKMRVVELTDENQSLWDMLDEIKAADEEAMNYKSVLNKNRSEEHRVGKDGGYR